mmetsp:Transcript_5313/g.8140  ORF Transcript_5313/g.8140 Transcript_5313/m.8140 type:complete len:200 (-) Transcript_5313:109-708(-)
MFTTMEVASPIIFGHVKAGAKRRLACSPLDTTANNMDDFAMDESASFGQSFKRRRCDNMEMSIAPQQAFPAFNQFNSSGTKRQRHEETQDTTSRRLQHAIDRQTVEIQKLKSEKESVVHAYKELNATHEKVQNENKVLKKVVAIKQERQDQYIAELDNLKRHKEYSDNLIAAMRNHIQNQQLHSNSGMGFDSGGPPNVY